MKLPLTILVAVATTSQLTRADTEIRNFRYPYTSSRALESRIDIPTSRLTSTQRQIELTVSSQEPDRWVELDLENDPSTAWTIRLSWPGSTPTKFDMLLYSYPYPDSDLDSSKAAEVDTRKLLLHIHASALSPRIPSLAGRFKLFKPALDYIGLSENNVKGTASADAPNTKSPRDLGNLNDILRIVHGDSLSSPSDAESTPFETRFHLVLEPLIWGFLPRTAIPALILMVIFAGGAAVTVPRVIKVIEKSRRDADSRGRSKVE